MNQTNKTIWTKFLISNPDILWDCLFIESEREREKEGCNVGSEMTWYEAGSWVTMGSYYRLQSYITYICWELQSLEAGERWKYWAISIGILSWMSTALVTTESPASPACKKCGLLISLGTNVTTVSSILNKVLVRPHLVVIRGAREAVKPPDMRVINPCWNVVDYKKC